MNRAEMMALEARLMGMRDGGPVCRHCGVGRLWNQGKIRGLVAENIGAGKRWRTMKELGGWLGVSEGFVSYLQSGKKEWNEEKVRRLLEGVGVDMGEGVS